MTNLPYISYSNPRFKNGQEHIVYGQISRDLQWTYSDRLIDWSYKTRKEPGQSDINYWETVLEMALNKKKVKIQCVVGGCNQSRGDGYYIFGYREEEQNNGQS